MQVAEFTVDGIPTKRRPRFTRGGYAYMDKRTYDEEAKIARMYDGPVFEGLVFVHVDIYPKLPKSTPKRVTSESRPRKPDVDNVLKVVMDALNGVAYADDSQVAEAVAVRHPAERIEAAHVKVTVGDMKGDRQ